MNTAETSTDVHAAAVKNSAEQAQLAEQPAEFAELFAIQQQLAAAVREPALPVPLGISRERLAVYRELVLNNVSGFIRSTYPVLRQICGDTLFDQKISAFFRQSQLDSPYFVDIPQAFLDWLPAHASDLPPFALELAHYEWLELDLFRRAVPAEAAPAEALHSAAQASLTLNSQLQLTPLLEVVAYQYPVHQLSVQFQPTTPPANPTFLALYRNRAQQVRFLQLTALSSASLQLLQQQPCLQQVLATLMPLVPALAEDELSHGLLTLAQQLLDSGIARLLPPSATL